MPFAFPPFIAMAAVVAGVAAARVFRREWQRINEDLDHTGHLDMRYADIVERASLPKLRRDPATGVYRPE